MTPIKRFFLISTGFFNIPTLKLQILCFFSFCIPPTLLFSYFIPSIEASILFFMISTPFMFLLFYIADKSLNYLRTKIPYEKIKIIENNKLYIIHNFQAINIKKYYHNNKLHREIGAAVIYTGYAQDDLWYINGIKINKKDIQKEISKQKISDF